MGTPERELSALAREYGGTRESYREESPQHTLQLRACALARIPVTNAVYGMYVAATGARAPSHWHGREPPVELAGHPVVDVSWEEARAFCTWATTSLPLVSSDGRRLQRLRLPTEAEWEHGARGTDGRRFPWGTQWDPARAATRDSGATGTVPAGSIVAGASPYGLLDMAGNVWEWTASLDAPYPYRPDDGREDPGAAGRRILRGGCYANPRGYARCATRFRLDPAVRNMFLGFRLAADLAE